MQQIKELLKTVGFVVIFALFLLLLRQYVFTPVIVKGDSMDPTLHDGERVIALKNTEIERFDCERRKRLSRKQTEEKPLFQSHFFKRDMLLRLFFAHSS